MSFLKIDQVFAKVVAMVGAGLLIFFLILRFAKYPTPYTLNELLAFELVACMVLLPMIFLYLLLAKYVLRFNRAIATLILLFVSVIFSGISMIMYGLLVPHFPVVFSGGNVVPQVVVNQFVAVIQLMFLVAIGIVFYEKLKRKK
jgi:hypothetical protein